MTPGNTASPALAMFLEECAYLAAIARQRRAEQEKEGQTMTNQSEGVVEELLRDRRAEVAQSDAEETAYQARPGGPMTREQFRARLANIEARHTQANQRRAA